MGDGDTGVCGRHDGYVVYVYGDIRIIFMWHDSSGFKICADEQGYI